MKFKLEVDIEMVDVFEDNIDTIARIYYPDEGNVIKIVKGLNSISFISECFKHEIAHLVDWYLSNGKQSKSVNIREKIAEEISQKI